MSQEITPMSWNDLDKVITVGSNTTSWSAEQIQAMLAEEQEKGEKPLASRVMMWLN